MNSLDEHSKALAAFAAIGIAILATLGPSACTSDPESTTVLRDVPVDSVVFWPPAVRYAQSGDTLSPWMRGVQRQRRCGMSDVDTLSWSFRRDSTGSEYYTPRSLFEIRSSCPVDREGLDSLYKVRVYTKVGKYFYLETPDGRLTDSVLFISGDVALPSRMDTLLHVVPDGSITTRDGLTFRDSSATHPQRTVEADSLAACEVLQAAVFDRRGDTLAVRVRRIQGTTLPVDLLPACAGVHADTLDVVPNLYRFP